MNTSANATSPAATPPAASSSNPIAEAVAAPAPSKSSTRLAVAHSKPLALLTIAAVALGQATCFEIGVLSGLTVGPLLLSIVACCLGLNALREKAPARGEKAQSGKLVELLLNTPMLTRLANLDPLLFALWFCLVLWQVLVGGVALQGILAQIQMTPLVAFVFMLFAIVGTVWSLRSPAGWWLQLLCFVGIGWWLIAHRVPAIDVLIFQNDSCAALLRGANPYTLTFANIYPDDSPFYGPGMSVNGQLQFGYVYMPLTLLLALPGYLLGDVRISHMMTMAISALLLAGIRPRAEKALLGALFLWTPVVYFVLYLGWTDPVCVLTLCFIYFCARRRPSWLPIACGLFLASKQYAFLAMPLFWLLVPLTASASSQNDESSTRLRGESSWPAFWMFLGKSLAVMAIVTLPLALWDFGAFFYSTMLLQFKQPFRPDSLSFMAMWSNLGWGLWPWWVAFGLTLLAMTWALRRAPRNEIGFLTAVALVFLIFFAFNKQAFVNYYYFVLGALWCATMALFERSLSARNSTTTAPLLVTEAAPHNVLENPSCHLYY